MTFDNYTHHGHKLRFSQSKKAQFPGTVRQDRCVTGGIISGRGRHVCRAGGRPGWFFAGDGHPASDCQRKREIGNCGNCHFRLSRFLYKAFLFVPI